MSTSHNTVSAKPKRYTSYTPDLKCDTDGNGYGKVNTNIGLMNYDEVILAGGSVTTGSDYYLTDSDSSYWWTMSPSGYDSSSSSGFNGAVVWYVRPATSGTLAADWNVSNTDYFRLRPVINLRANVTATGTGTELDPYLIQQ